MLHFGGGRWWDGETARGRDGTGRWVRRLKPPRSVIERIRRTRVRDVVFR